MDSKRLTEIEERCEKFYFYWDDRYKEFFYKDDNTPLNMLADYEPCHHEYQLLSRLGQFSQDLPDLVAAYKLLRADAAELARAAQRLYQILQPERDETRALNDAMNGGQSARFDLSEQHMFANLKASLSRPSVVNLLKEKDQ